jgi:hypothetical protein
MEHQFEIESFVFEGKCYDISVSFEYEVGNDGIGSYEYWGSKEFDAGNDYAEVTSVAIEAVEVSEDGEHTPVEDKALLARLENAIDGIVNDKASQIDVSDDSEREPDDYEPDYD